ncbi:MAG: hypothetical protein R3E42_14150 [Burkholderiaceae bacterium]
MDLIAQRAQKLGDMGIARLAVTADGDELHVLLAGLGNTSAADQTPAAAQQHKPDRLPPALN